VSAVHAGRSASGSCEPSSTGRAHLAYFRLVNALFIACSDGRVADALAALQEQEGESGADRLLVPGGPLVLTRPGNERRVALDCVRTQMDVHGIRTIYLVSHQDCAAYERALGGLGFDQRELLARDLQRVRALLENAFPDVDVRCFVIPWRENGGGAAFGAAEAVD
jgi:carbonic anhydrase